MAAHAGAVEGGDEAGGGGEGTAEGVDDDRRPDLRGGGAEPGGVGDEHLGGAELPDGVGLRRIAGLTPDTGPEPGREADDGEPDPAARAEDEHPVVGGDAGEVDDAVGGQAGDAGARRLIHGHAVGYGDECVPGRDDVPGVDAVAHHAEPVAVDEDRRSVDLTGRLQADGAWQRSVGGDGACGGVAVDRVDPGAAQGHEHLAGPRLRERDVLDDHRFTMAVQPGRAGAFRACRRR